MSISHQWKSNHTTGSVQQFSHYKYSSLSGERQFQQMQIHFQLARVKLGFQSSEQIKRCFPNQDAPSFKRIGYE